MPNFPHHRSIRHSSTSRTGTCNRRIPTYSGCMQSSIPITPWRVFGATRWSSWTWDSRRRSSRMSCHRWLMALCAHTNDGHVCIVQAPDRLFVRWSYQSKYNWPVDTFRILYRQILPNATEPAKKFGKHFYKNVSSASMVWLFAVMIIWGFDNMHACVGYMDNYHVDDYELISLPFDVAMGMEYCCDNGPNNDHHSNSRLGTF